MNNQKDICADTCWMQTLEESSPLSDGLLYINHAEEETLLLRFILISMAQAVLVKEQRRQDSC